MSTLTLLDWSPLWISLHTAVATIIVVFFIGVLLAWQVERLLFPAVLLWQ